MESGQWGKAGGGPCAAAIIFVEKAIKLCSLINGHHQDLFPAQIKLKVMDGVTAAGRAEGGLVLSDGLWLVPGFLGSRGPAQAG